VFALRRLVLAVIALALAWPSAAAAAAPVCSPATCTEQGQSRSIVLKRSSWDKKRPKGSASRTKGRKTSLRVSVRFAPKGSKPRVTVTGPRGFRKVISKSTTFRNVRHGRYKIVAAPIPGRQVTTFATYHTTRAKLRKGVAGWVGVRYMQRVQSSTRVADPSAIETVSGDPNGVREIVVHDPQALVEPGTVLAAGVGPQTPAGMLVQVDAVTRSGDKTIARGGPAPLTEIGPQAEIISRPQLKMTREEFQQAVAAGQTGRSFKRALPGFSLDGKPKAFAAAKKNKGFDSDLKCSGGARASFNGDVNFDAGTDVGIAWGGWLKPLTIKAYVGVKLHQDAKMQITVEGEAKCELELDLLREDHRFSPWTFSIGPVPVVIVPKLNFQVTGEAAVGARLTSSVEQALDTSFGVQWDGSRFGPYGKASASFRYSKPNPSGTLKVKAAIGPKLAFDFYDVAGPYLTADLFMQLKADTSADPWWRLSGGLQAGGGLRFKVWEINFDKGIRDIWSEDWTIAKADKPAVPAFTTKSLPDADRSQAYSTNVAAKSSRGPLKYSIASGRLPDGLKLSEDGKISGTPTGYGSHQVEIAAKDTLGQRGLRTFTIKVKTPPATITTGSLPAATVGVGYSARLEAGGSVAPYAWEVSAGSLPPGLHLSGEQISGTPTEIGARSFTLRVRGSDGSEASKQFTIAVGPPPVRVTTSALARGKAYVAYSQTLTATGGRGAYTWSATNVPGGLTLNAAGTLSGTPTGPSSAPLQVTVTDADGRTATADVALTIDDVEPLTITTGALADGMEGVAYDQPLAATGGRAPYTFSATGLPAGLTVAAGKLSGTPATAGTSTVTLKVTDVDGRTAQRALELKILPPGIEITTTALPMGQLNEAYEAELAVLGGTAPYTWSITAGTLHSGLTLNPSTGRISGTPMAGGSQQITFKVVGADGATATKQLTLDVSTVAGKSLLDLSCPSASMCMATDVDSNAYIRSADGTWSAAMPTGLTLYPKVSCASETYCMAADRAPAVALWNGTGWSALPTPPLATNILDVECLSSTYCVAAGARAASPRAVTWKWDGTTWDGPLAPTSGGSSWVRLACPAVDSCMLTGWMTATFDGTDTTVHNPLSYEGATYEGSSVDCVSITECFAGSSNKASVFDGTTWTDAPTIGGKPLQLSGVGCARTGSTCAAGGHAGGNGLWTYDGTEWTNHAPKGTNVTQSDCVSPTLCVAVTSAGQSQTFDGTTWTLPRTFARG